MWIDFGPIAEFTDRHGEVCPVRGCSLVGRVEFFQRITEIWQCLKSAPPGQSFQQLYDLSPRIRYLVCRSLELNGIDPERVTLEQAEQLLLSVDGGIGYLVDLNQSKGESADPPASLEQVIAALSLQGGLTEAIALATSVPADILLDVVKSRNDLTKTPEEKQKEGKREWAKNMREEARKKRERMVTPT